MLGDTKYVYFWKRKSTREERKNKEGSLISQ